MVDLVLRQGKLLQREPHAKPSVEVDPLHQRVTPPAVNQLNMRVETQYVHGRLLIGRKASTRSSSRHRRARRTRARVIPSLWGVAVVRAVPPHRRPVQTQALPVVQMTESRDNGTT